MNRTEIKIELFADDLTVFLGNDESFSTFFDVVSKFGDGTGLTINLEKTEIFLLGNSGEVCTQDHVVNLEVKDAVTILGVHVTYNRYLRKKLNFIEIISSIKKKLQLWKWRNLTVFGRIQIVKTFAIPMLMYRAGSICIDKEVITEANKIIYNFIWKGKDKVKRTSRISDTNNGGLKALHLESIINTQRIMVCK